MSQMSAIAAPETAHEEGYSTAGSLSMHVASAAAIGGGLATIVEWGVEVGLHVTTPTQVDDAISAICIFAVSLLMRKLMG